MNILNKYFSLFYIAYRSYVAYIYDIIWVNFLYILRIIIIIFLYKSIYSFGQGTINWYSLFDISWALIFTQSVVVSNPRVVVSDISNDVKTGKIGIFLLNPVPYVWFKFFEYFSKFLYHLLISLVIWIIMWLILLGGIKTSLSWIFAGITLLFWSMFIEFFGNMMMWLLAFYTEDNEAFRFIYSKFSMVLGGNILPIPFLPLFFQTIAFLSPFAYAWYTAWLIFINFNLDNFLKFFFIQWIWVVIYIWICLFIYRQWSKNLCINWG